jgi:hypothetical protein
VTSAKGLGNVFRPRPANRTPDRHEAHVLVDLALGVRIYTLRR